jgi:hypothetical protein
MGCRITTIFNVTVPGVVFLNFRMYRCKSWLPQYARQKKSDTLSGATACIFRCFLMQQRPTKVI